MIDKIKALIKQEPVREFIRFCIVGVICTALDSAVFYTVRIFAPYQVALVSGYLLSLIANYFLTIYWTFQSKPNKKNAVGIIVAHLFNLFVVRMGLMYLFVDIMDISDKIAYVPTLLISVVTNFIIIKFIVNKLK